MKMGARLWNKATQLVGSAVILGVILALVLFLLSAHPVTHATTATTQHQHPNLGVSGVSYICLDGGYSCTSASAYIGTNATGWARSLYGCPYASGCAAGTPHNCTLYVAFRLMQNGVVDNPGWADNATDWATRANSHGIQVDQTPAVGSIAQWNAGIGHVAYVEVADSSGITLTMDDYYTSNPWPNGYTAKIHITVGSPAWPDNFIHWKDQTVPSQPTSGPTVTPTPPSPPPTPTPTRPSQPSPTPTPRPPSPTPTPTPTPSPTPHPVNAYSNYGPANTGYPMCRGNPSNPQSMPGGWVIQTFIVPDGVSSLDSALIQIDPDPTVTAHLGIGINNVLVATADAAAAGDTRFSFGPIPVVAGDEIALQISFTATYGKIITVYTAGDPGGTFSTSNSCPAGASNVSTTSTGLRAIVSGMS